MKNSFEGSQSLQTEVKYKAPKRILPRPTILTLNANSIGDIFKWHYSEMENFMNRCYFIRMDTLLEDRIDADCIGALSTCSEDLLYHLHGFIKNDVKNLHCPIEKDCAY